MLIFIDWNLLGREDVIEDFLFCLTVVLLLYGNVLKKQFLVDALCFFYVWYFVMETTSYLAVSSNFSSSYMYLLLESNKQELSEFTKAYFSLPIFLFIILSGAIFFIIRKKRLKQSNKYQSAVGILGCTAIVVLLKLTGLIENNAYHNIVRGTYGYITLQNSLKLNTNIKAEDISVKADNEVLVFVLGESTARNRMEIYGYNRKNTPLLNAIKDSLLVYNNVISTDVFTLKALPKMLTSLDVDSKKENHFNIVEVFNAAGYTTYWLSNQRPISYHDNAISKIASRAKMFKFYNHIIDKNTLVLDEILLPDYNNILKKPGKKAIFIRLIGTHFDYNKRYPSTFNKFNANPKHKSKENITISHYDNAVFYNDFILYSILESLEKMNTKSALLYLSDHGENIYDDGTSFFGRSEEVITKSMFEIPFLLWTSNSFTFPKDFEYKPDRVFMADHTYESIGHVFGVMHKSMDASKSIFSKSFKPRQRKVLGTIDFDDYFSVKDE
ncbi:phosphoethanolamine transferase [Hwangdonia lutea]|uniref:Phosphoethanolamine transferase n=1 Tax=Hwangdonia lutea TaxID=3075823 RepID=A0AA97HQZ3_9FLAO|nr:phosphoethanolamine transferase [Hwangdonia sp. SCSIO 19198]WOD42903.1 phosphoethanolamine transferase [Hwangdonia sp. SCSIO 19198]